MATARIKFRPSSVEGQEGRIFYQVIHGRVARQINSGLKMSREEWEAHNAIGDFSEKNPSRRAENSPYHSGTWERARRDMERLTRIIRLADCRGVAYTADDIAAEFHCEARRLSVREYVEGVAQRLRELGKRTTASHYRSALASLTRFMASQGEEDITLDGMTAELMQAYEAWLRRLGVGRNASSAYMRTLRAAYNRAVEENLIEQARPFRRVYTGIEKTEKRAVTLKTIGRIKELDLSAEQGLVYARDMFLMSFYMRGMSFVDMAFLKKSDLRDGYVTYRRRKTGRRLSIRWTPEMQGILERYPANASEYLLPIIRQKGLNEHCAYRNALERVNKGLKRIGDKVGVAGELTLYVARHSWASGALAQGVPLRVISEGMGHDSESTTRIYLAQLDTTAVDEANDRVLSSIR